MCIEVRVSRLDELAVLDPSDLQSLGSPLLSDGIACEPLRLGHHCPNREPLRSCDGLLYCRHSLIHWNSSRRLDGEVRACEAVQTPLFAGSLILTHHNY